MTDKELRRLSRSELLWIIRDQEAEIIELKAQLGILKEEEPNNKQAEDESNDQG